MMIELTGSTGAGKSTLASGMLQAYQQRGIDMLMGDDLVLKQIRLSRVKNRWLRLLGVDLVALLTCLATWQRHHAFYAFALPIIFRLPIGGFEKLNLTRNVLKKIGVYEVIRHRSAEQQIILVDEGTLHAAHNLFVHVAVAPNVKDVAAFLQLVPLPDLAVYVRQSESVLIARTLARGHKRIPDRSHANVEHFIERSVEVSDQVAQQLALDSRLVVVDGRQSDALDQVITALYKKIECNPRNTTFAHARA